MIYKSGDVYSGTGFWWDEDDNEYGFTTTWEFHRNMPDQPDEWVLIEVEFEDCSVMLSNAQYQEVHDMCREGGLIWNTMERYGVPSDAREVSWI